MSHNFEQNLCESLAPSGCHRLKRKKNVCRELGRTSTRFVLARTFHTLLKACEALCLSAPATDAVLCAQCSVSLILRIINHLRVFMCLSRQVAGLSSLKPNKPFPLLHTDHAHSTFLTNQTTLLRDQTRKTNFPAFVEYFRSQLTETYTSSVISGQMQIQRTKRQLAVLACTVSPRGN